jgi:hypothetical protein
MNNNPAVSTTKPGIMTGAVFARYLDDLQSIIYVSYFGYHKPIVSFLDYEQTDTSKKRILLTFYILSLACVNNFSHCVSYYLYHMVCNVYY